MKKNKEVTINQHYIPQFYLNNFSYLNKKNKPCIDVYDIDLNKHLINQKIQHVASEKYFYDIDMEKYLKDASKPRKIIISIILKLIYGFKFKLSSFKQLNIVEHKLGDIESKTSPILTELIIKSDSYTLWEMKNCFFINEQNKRLLSLYLAIQFLRTPKSRQTINEVYSYIKPTLIREFHYRETGETLNLEDLVEEINEENIKQQHLQYLFNDKTNKIADAFNKHHWIFYKNTTDVDFITSDSPISTKSTRDESHMSFSGINSKGVMVLFPISKKLLLIMYQDELNKDAYDKKLMICNNPEIVESYNLVIFLNSHRFLYGEDKELRKFDEFAIAHKKSTDSKIVLVNSIISSEE